MNNCTEADLRAALAGGGTVTFACDGTIVLTNELVIAQDTVIDATGRAVTLSGNDAVRVLKVNTNVSLTLKHLTIAHGLAAGIDASSPTVAQPGDGLGGGVYNEGGLVQAVACTFSGNVARGGRGALVSYGVSSGGGSGLGGGLYSSGGSIGLESCALLGNHAQGGKGANEVVFAGVGGEHGGEGRGGALYVAAGEIVITNTLLTGNRALGGEGGNADGFNMGSGAGDGGDGEGGALSIVGGRLRITDGLFVTNGAVAGPKGGWARWPSSSSGNGQGGAIGASGATVTLTRSQFLGNSAMGDLSATPAKGCAQGGAIAHNGSSLEAADCLFQTNFVQAGIGYSAPYVGRTGSGGALHLAAGTMRLTNSTFSANRAIGGYGTPPYDPFSPGPTGPSTGGRGEGGALLSGGDCVLVNCTFSGNVAQGGSGYGFGGDASGGGIANPVGNLTLVHATVAANAAIGGDFGTYTNGSLGRSLGGGVAGSRTNRLRNSVLANNTLGGNWWGSGLVDDGNNLSSDATPVFTAPGSRNNTDPKLGPLGDYGGPTPTIPLLEGSPALDAANPAYAPLTDQRGQPRPVGAGYDIGAFEGSLPGPPVLTMSFSPRSAVTGMVTTLSYVLDNPNASTLNNVSFTNWLPAALRVADPPGVVNGCGNGTVTAQAEGEHILVTGVTLTNHQSCLITVNIVGQSIGVFTNTAGPISSAEGGAAPALATAVVTLIAPPSAVTGVASDVQEHSVVFNGTVNPNGSVTMVWFEYGPTPSYGSQSSVRDMGSGYSTLVVSNLVADLPSYGFYHYRLVAQNDAGTASGADTTARLLGLARTNLALRLDGTNDFVSIGGGGGLNGVSEGTIELWARWTGVQPDEPTYGLYGAVFSRQGSFGLQDILALDNRHPAFAHVIWSPYSPSGAILGTALVGDGVWRHIAVTFRPGGHRLYVDGVLQGTSAALGVLGNDPMATLRLGSLATAPDRFAACVVDEVRIWSGMRSPEEIAYFRTHPLDSSTSGLIAYWRLDEGSGLVAHDATGHGFDGTLVNGPIWATALNPVDYGMTLEATPTDTAFRLDLIGQPGRPFVLEGSGDLLEWVGAVTNQFGVDCRFQHDAPPSSATPVRFYRIVAP